MNKLKLDKSLLLGKGHERLCYIHPEDNTKVIKIAHKELDSRNQNKVESIYYEYLYRTNADLSHIALCYGYVMANDREGLVFDRVLNSDKSIPLTFAEAIKSETISKEYAKLLLDDLKGYLRKNNIIFADVGLDNIMCSKQDNDEYKLVIVDGLGSRRPGLKLWLYTHIPLYAQYKIRIQWNKVIANFNKNYGLYNRLPII